MMTLIFILFLTATITAVKTKSTVLKWIDSKLPSGNYKVRLIDFYIFLTDIALFILSCFVFYPLTVLGIIYTAIKHLFFKFDYAISKQLGAIVRALTLLNDGMANASAGELLNDIIKPKYVKYGKWYQTISAITGINYVKGDDNSFRQDLDDFLGPDHCKNAITEEEKCYYKI